MATTRPIPENFPLRWDAVRQLYVATQANANHLAALVNKHGSHLEGFTPDMAKAHIQSQADGIYDGEEIDWLATAAIAMAMAGI